MSAKRLDYIDAAKAIAIILVIIGHSNWLSAIPRVGRMIYSFHMPLFFIISGFFWKSLIPQHYSLILFISA